MDYLQTCAYLKSLDRLGSVPGLDSIRELLRRLENPQKNTRFVHISGTNGKGSVGAFVTSVLLEAGFCVGRYLSPAVQDPLEIIQCGGHNILPEEFASIISRIRRICGAMLEEGLPHPTRFEIETAAAFVFFSEKECDIAVVECGMGGLLDATNIIENTDCAVITPISADHTAFLGDTTEEIAFHKAGIIKPHAIAVYAAGDESVNRVIEARAAECGCPTRAVTPDMASFRVSDEGGLVLEHKKYPDARLGLSGVYQALNAALAIECIEALKAQGHGIPREAVYRGLAKTRWFGRFERLGRRPDFILDGAHNPAGAKALAESLGYFYTEGGLTFIIGVFADKDYKKMLEYLIPMAARVFTIGIPDNPRALSSKILAEHIKKYYDVMSVSVTDSGFAKAAVDAALEQTDSSKAVIAFGSLSHLALIAKEYRRRIEV